MIYVVERGINMKNLNYLKTFLTIIKYPSLAEYSKKTNTAHAYATHVIKEIEKEFGCQVMSRYRNRIQLQLTPAGLHIAEKAPGLMAQLSNLHKSTQRIVNPNTIVSFNLYVARSICDSIICKNLLKIKDAVPEVHLNIHPRRAFMSHDEKVGSLTIGAHVPTNTHDCIEQVHLHDYPVNLWGSREYFLLHGKPQSIEDLKDHQFVTYSLNSSLCEMLKKHNVFNKKNITVVETPSGIAISAISGVGLTFATHSAFSLMGAHNCEIVLPDFSTTLSLFFSFPQDWKNSLFIEKLTTLFKQILSKA